MNKAIIHAHPANHPLTNKQFNAKYYPYWDKVIEAFPELDWYQIGVQGNYVINGVKPLFDLSLKSIYDLAMESSVVCSIDSFLPHLMAPSKKKLIVIYTVSDPKIFGYNHNINLYKPEFLRESQFDVWNSYPWNKDSCVDPNEVIAAIKSIVSR